MKEVVAQRHLVHPVPVAEQILQPPNSGRVGCVPRVADVDVATHQQNIPAFQERPWPVLAVLVGRKRLRLRHRHHTRVARRQPIAHGPANRKTFAPAIRLEHRRLDEMIPDH